MASRVAILSVILEEQSDKSSAETLNRLLSEYSEYVVGRMGIPYRKRHINIVSVVVDAPQTVISAMAGKIGRIPHVTSKTVYSNVSDPDGTDG